MKKPNFKLEVDVQKIWYLATRSSALALKQTEIICSAVLKQYPDLVMDTLPLITDGDRYLDRLLKDIGGKGIFVKEIQQALLDRKADWAVHSLKDLPLQTSDHLFLGLSHAETIYPFDVLVGPWQSWKDLPYGAKIGTSSLRRAVQMKRLRPDCQIMPVRGNVLTRLSRLDALDFDGLILAEAGLQRLAQKRKYSCFELYEMVPAFNQGIIGVECRTCDYNSIALFQKIQNHSIAIRVEWERAVAGLLQASCKSAIGIYANVLCCSPLKVELSVFASIDWETVCFDSITATNLKEALDWVYDRFELNRLSWNICHANFT